MKSEQTPNKLRTDFEQTRTKRAPNTDGIRKKAYLIYFLAAKIAASG
jgi:hypothetical protein